MSLVGERIKEAFSARTRKTCAGNCICTGNHILRALTLTIVTALFMLVIPQVITSILSLVSVLPDQLDNSNKWLHDMLEKYPTMQQSWDGLYAELSTRLREWLKTDLTPMLQTIINGLSNQVVNIVGFLKMHF